MGKRKTETTNTYQYMPPPETADTTALREMKATADPSIPYQYAKAREAQSNSMNNPLGAYSSSASRDNSARVTNQALAQDEAAANQASQFQADNANFQRRATVAGFTNPHLVQTGGTQTTSGGFWSGLLAQGIGAGAQLGSAAMT